MLQAILSSTGCITLGHTPVPVTLSHHMVHAPVGRRLQGMHAWCDTGADVLIADSMLTQVFASGPTGTLTSAFQRANATATLFLPLHPSAAQLAVGGAQTQCLNPGIVDCIRGSLFLACLHCIAVMLRCVPAAASRHVVGWGACLHAGVGECWGSCHAGHGMAHGPTPLSPSVVPGPHYRTARGRSAGGG